MEFKFIVVFAAVVSIVKAYPSAVVAPVAVAARLSDSEFDPNPQYSFAYDVQDALTGDSKSHTETRDGGLVRGQYSVSDPDGTRRVVEYIADPINGFNAVVSKSPLVAPVAVAPVVAKSVVPAAPVVAPSPFVAAAAPYAQLPARVAAPLTYPSPLAFTSPYNSIARLSYISPYTVY